MAVRSLHNPAKGKLKFIGFISGSGKTLWRVLELQRELEKTPEGSPFEVAGVFSSDPEAKGVASAAEYGIPCLSLDIREYYKKRQAKLKDQGVRKEYDTEVSRMISDFRPDLVLLAGYVWAATEVLLNRYMFINVHPADLTRQENGKRLFAGPNGVGDALSAGEPYLRSSSHIATTELDGGPLLIVSPKIPVDYQKAREYDEKEFMRHYLKQVNAQSREVGARTIYEIAMGHFSRDSNGKVFYRGEHSPFGVTIESWKKNVPLYARSTEALLRPKSIAVVGASSRGGIGHAIVKNIEAVDFHGEAFAVNRKGETVLNTPGYTSILDIPDEVELAVLTIPSQYVLEAAEECGRKGVKAIVCISAGFREVGEEGAEAEKKLLSIVNTYNMRLLGPNCMGISNNESSVRLNSTILHDIPRVGNIALVSQSGGLGAVLLDYAEDLGIGFSVIASLGNQADVNVNDLLPLLAEDPHTEVILLYLEQISDYQRFARIASMITPRKPIVLLKAGRTGAGAAAAGSHTGSLAGDDQVADALIRKCGVIRVESIYQGYYVTAALSRMPRVKGNRVAVITNGGGPGILASDALSDRGFEIPSLGEDAERELAGKLLPEASARNPIDLVAPAPPEHYAAALRSVVESGNYDAAVILCIPPATVDTGKVAERIAEEIKELEGKIEEIPILACFFGPGLGRPGRKALNAAGIPVAEYPEQSGEILHAMRTLETTYSPDQEPAYGVDGETEGRVAEILDAAGPGSFLGSAETEEVLTSYGLRTVPSVFVEAGNPDRENGKPDRKSFERSIEKAVEERGLTFPLVAKIEHPKVIHKSDEGGVVLHIADKERLLNVCRDMLLRFEGARGVLIQQELPSDTEVILGAVKDPSVGHAVMVGLGGTSVELLGDVAFAHVPYNSAEALRAVKSLKSAPLLTGYRGKPGVNIDDLVEQMQRLNRLILDFPEIAEIDLNPLLYSSRNSRFFIADFRLRID
ncbi:MAG: acetate--CoA ligase family protein [Spirochaetia bacterium]